ncbi:MAG: glycosyltransferase, partial [Nitrososphaerales archaeon]
EDGYQAMCRRAYLVYKWHFRSDLKDLLRQALVDDQLPELYGFDNFLAALRKMDGHELLDGVLVDFIGKARPSKVFDYGCGNGGLADKLAQWEIEVVAYDVDSSRYGSHYHPANTKFVGRRQLEAILDAGTKYDSVLCSLVLCSVGDSAVRPIVSDLRRLVSEAGNVVIVICNPFDMETSESECHTKSVPIGVAYSDHFSYQKVLKATGGRRRDYHRPLSWYKAVFKRAGFQVADLVEARATDIPRLTPSSEFLILRLSPARMPEQSNVSLLIKVSSMEWRTIGKQVTHIVGQLEYPRLFLERLVVVDNYDGLFSRQYDAPDVAKMKEELQSLVDDGTIDRVLVAPSDGATLSSMARRWFSIDAVVSRSENGQPTMTTLYGFEQCSGQYVLQTDSDSLIFRPDKEYDYLEGMLESFRKDPNLVTLSFSIACKTQTDYTKSLTGKKWRTEVRCGILEIKRLVELLPLPNSIGASNKLKLPWHRALDQRLSASDRQSYRGADPKAFYIHVPNSRKTEANSWYNIMKAVESGRLYEAQIGKVDLVGATEDWLLKRMEDYVLIVRGRDVPASKLRRCFDSLAVQSDQAWGLVVVDAGSVNGMDEYISEIIGPKYGGRLTFYRNVTPVVPVENIYYAIRTLCGNPRSVVLMPDADDALLYRDAIEYVKSQYTRGADLAIGGLLRTDRQVFYPANFDSPRASRGGNVWQPLRTFRKYLFDGISVNDLKVDGVWVPHTEDWAIMLPMAEQAVRPIQFGRTIYLYEPSSLKDSLSKEEREALIARIVDKSPYRRIGYA